jgi:hypothetical protein
VQHSAARGGYSIENRENAKITKYRANLARNGMDFAPFVFSIYGGVGKRATAIIQDVAIKIAVREESDVAVELQRAYTELSIVLMSSLAHGVLERLKQLPPLHRAFL